MGLLKGAAAGDTVQLPPGPTIGMAIGPDITQAHPASILAGRFETELVLGIHLALASARGDWQRGRGGREQGRVCLGRVLTGGTERLCGEARKRLRLLRTPRGALDRLAMDRGHRGLVP